MKLTGRPRRLLALFGHVAPSDASVQSAPKVGAWTHYLFGSLGEMLARSVRVSNRKLREECAWVPKYPSTHEGWRAVAAAIPPTELRG